METKKTIDNAHYKTVNIKQNYKYTEEFKTKNLPSLSKASWTVSVSEFKKENSNCTVFLTETKKILKKYLVKYVKNKIKK